MKFIYRFLDGPQVCLNVIDFWFVSDLSGFCGIAFSLGDLEPDHFIPLCDLSAVRLLP